MSTLRSTAISLALLSPGFVWSVRHSILQFIMKHVLVLSSLATSVTIARAAPAHSLRAPGSSIATQCINSQIRQNWLVSECLTGVDSTTRIESATYLGNKVENRDGDLAWSTGCVESTPMITTHSLSVVANSMADISLLAINVVLIARN